MSPRSPRYPSPASGDDAAPSGRHRRPETLAEVVPPRAANAEPIDALTRAALTEPSALYRALSEPTPSSPFPSLTPRARATRSKGTRSWATRSDQARSDDARSDDARSDDARSSGTHSDEARSGQARSSGTRSRRRARSNEAASHVAGSRDAGSSEARSNEDEEPSATRRRETTGPRHSRHSDGRSSAQPDGRSSAQPHRRSAAQSERRPSGRTSGRAERRRPPVTGSHRAPGTLPIESWLLLGKKRQQILLASLVAAALLLVGIPMRQQGIDAVDAAAARTVGVHIGKSKAKDKDSKPAHDTAAADARVTSPAPKPSGSPSAKAPAAEVRLPAKDLGPGHSLRTTGSKAISLTFDDGPDPVQTPKILALLAKYQIKATFCLIGSNVQKHPEVVREIVAAGHTLCNHTWNHSLTIGKDKPEQIRADLERTSAAIRAAVPDARIPFFRAPGGNFTDRLVGVAQGQGMASLYWAVDPRDWDHPKGETDPAHVARVIKEVRKVKPGSIILSHDFNQPDTIEAYSKLLPWLKANFTITIPGMPAGHAPSAPDTTAPSTSPPPTPPAGLNPAATPSAPVDPAADS